MTSIEAWLQQAACSVFHSVTPIIFLKELRHQQRTFFRLWRFVPPTGDIMARSYVTEEGRNVHLRGLLVEIFYWAKQMLKPNSYIPCWVKCGYGMNCELLWTPSQRACVEVHFVGFSVWNIPILLPRIMERSNYAVVDWLKEFENGADWWSLLVWHHLYLREDEESVLILPVTEVLPTSAMVRWNKDDDAIILRLCSYESNIFCTIPCHK